MNPESTSEVLSALRDAQKRLTDLARPFKDAERLLKDLSEPRTRQDLKKVGVLLSRLRALPPVQTELAAELAPLVETLEAFVREQERSRPLYFGRSLREAAEAQGVAFSALTSEPPEYRLDPFTVGADFRKGSAELRYARLAVCEVDLDPEALLKARLKMLEALQTKDFCPELFFDRLLTAYRRVLGGRAMGERINLVDLPATTISPTAGSGWPGIWPACGAAGPCPGKGCAWAWAVPPWPRPGTRRPCSSWRTRRAAGSTI